MEIIIALLLVVVIYQLIQLNPKKDGDGKKTAFTKKEWDDAVNEYYSKQYQDDASKGIVGMPGYSVWKPPSYEEVKDNLNALKALQEMTGEK